MPHSSQCLTSSWSRKALRIIRVLRRARQGWLAGRRPGIGRADSAFPEQGLEPSRRAGRSHRRQGRRWATYGNSGGWASRRGVWARGDVRAAGPITARNLHGGANCQFYGAGAEELAGSAIVDAEVEVHGCACGAGKLGLAYLSDRKPDWGRGSERVTNPLHWYCPQTDRSGHTAPDWYLLDIGCWPSRQCCLHRRLEYRQIRSLELAASRYRMQDRRLGHHRRRRGSGRQRRCSQDSCKNRRRPWRYCSWPNFSSHLRHIYKRVSYGVGG